MARSSTRCITLCALFTALGSVMVYASDFIPSGVLALLAVAGLFTTAARIHCGLKYSVITFAATAILSAFIVSDKNNVIMYAAFFGYYPILKSLFEKQESPVVRWTLKFVLLNIVLAVLYYFAREFFMYDIPDVSFAVLLAFGFFNVAFLLFDILLTRLIAYYMQRIYRYVEKPRFGSRS